MICRPLDSLSKPTVTMAKVLEFLGAEVVHRMILQEQIELLIEQAALKESENGKVADEELQPVPVEADQSGK